MKKLTLITTLLAFLFVTNLLAQTTFEKLYNGLGTAVKVEEHEDGGFTFLSQLPVPWPGFGGQTCILNRTDPYGELVWARELEIKNITDFYFTTNDEYLLPGGRNIEFWNGIPKLLKLDHYGNLIDTVDIPFNHRYITETHDNNYMLAGESFEYRYPMLAKITDAGDTLWTKQYDLFDCQVSGLVKNVDNGFTMTGFALNTEADSSFIITTDKYGNLLWVNIYENIKTTDICQSYDYGWMVIGNFDSDIILIRTDANGGLVDRLTYDLGGWETGTSICRSEDFGYILSMMNNWVGALARIDIDGEMTWYSTYANSCGLHDVMPTQDGGLISSGYYYVNANKPYLLKTTQTGLITSLDEKQEKKFDISFSPNPFSHTAHISYKVLTASNTKISVLDLEGRLISLIVDEFQVAGIHRISTDASAIPAGMYLCRLENGDRQVTLKVIKQ
jgi:hypothetical protein